MSVLWCLMVHYGCAHWVNHERRERSKSAATPSMKSEESKHVCSLSSHRLYGCAHWVNHERRERSKSAATPSMQSEESKHVCSFSSHRLSASLLASRLPWVQQTVRYSEAASKHQP